MLKILGKNMMISKNEQVTKYPMGSGQWLKESLHPQYLLDRDGKKAFVVLPVDEYESLLEDIQDLGVIAERRDEPKLSLDDFERELKADGLLSGPFLQTGTIDRGISNKMTEAHGNRTFAVKSRQGFAGDEETVPAICS